MRTEGQTIVVRGWIAASLDAETATQRVSLRVDDAIDVTVSSNLRRPDVASVLNRTNLTYAGFASVISMARFAAGAHTLVVFVTEASKLLQPRFFLPKVAINIPEMIRIAPEFATCQEGRVTGSIDEWTVTMREDGAPHHDVFIRGWACDLGAALPAADVVAFAGSSVSGRAVIGYPRADVAAALGNPAFEHCGFRMRLALASESESAQLRIAALSAGGDCLAQLASVVERSAGGTTPAEPSELVLNDILDLERARRIAAEGTTFDAAFGVDTEAPAYFDDATFAADGLDVSHFTHYEASPEDIVEVALDLVPFPLEGATFVDLGCGKGRTLFVAARRPFARVLGVEVNPGLARVARENLARIGMDGLACADVEIAEADVIAFAPPPGDLVVYLYNPFDEVILRPIVERLANVTDARVAIVYYAPFHRHVIEENPAFEVAAEFENGVVFSLERRRGAGTRSLKQPTDR